MRRPLIKLVLVLNPGDSYHEGRYPDDEGDGGDGGGGDESAQLQSRCTCKYLSLIIN